MNPVAIAILSTIPYTIILIGLGLTIFTDRYISRAHKRIMMIILALAVSLIMQNLTDYLFRGPDYITLRTISAIYGYSVRPAIIVMFYHFIGGRKKNIPAWCLVGINAAVHMTALFSNIVFVYASENGSFVRGPLGYTCHITGAVLLLALFLLVIYEYRNRKKEMIFPIICIMFISLGVLLDSFLSIYSFSALSALTVSVVISCIFVYVWFHEQFVQRYEANLRAEQQIKIMVSQIQPHFLFNTIATFRALCKTNPEKAADVAGKFGRYLRQNLDYLDCASLIPFEKELDHTKIYADIEMVRFENVQVEYDIKDTDFNLPPLTVQPMVENAIRHGVRIRKEGIVSVSTYFSDNCHKIIIGDNGIGFNEEEIDNSEGTHIGIKNVRERIEKICGGTLDIESIKDRGTKITISIPEAGSKQ